MNLPPPPPLCQLSVFFFLAAVSAALETGYLNVFVVYLPYITLLVHGSGLCRFYDKTYRLNVYNILRIWSSSLQASFSLFLLLLLPFLNILTLAYLAGCWPQPMLFSLPLAIGSFHFHHRIVCLSVRKNHTKPSCFNGFLHGSY